VTQGTSPSSPFDPAAFLPRSWFEALVDLRISRPHAAREEADARSRRTHLAPDGRLVIVAADHPARMVTTAGAEPVAMGNRWALLSRVLRVLTAPGVDGLMATPDVVEEILMLSHLARRHQGRGWLDGKVIVGCMNRGGLAGAVFEIDDRMTAFTVEGLTRLGCDGGKVMVRIDLQDAGTVATLEACARAIDACHDHDLAVFLEAFEVDRTPAGPRPRTDAESLIRVAGVASALGTSTARTWLKMPYAPGYDRVAAATTLPILMLGGELRDDPPSVLDAFADGMAAGPTVRGALVGRNVSFAPHEDPRGIAAALGAVVHEGLRAGDARAVLARERGREMDLVSRLGDVPRGPSRVRT
jgi:DhnA family fructose-bisphosphate aldolase class Ia